MRRLVRWMQGLIRELRRRRVIRVAGVYAGTAFVILQLGEILVEPFGLPGWTLRMVTFLLVLGFPLAVGLAWVYNITEEGLVRDAGEEPPGKEAPDEIGPEGKPLTSNGVLVGLLVLIAGLLLYPRVFSSEEGADKPPSAPDPAQIDARSIAVLPFDPLSPDQKSKTFARGVHDDLLARLSNISDLTVISRTSVERYRDTTLPLPAIADSLGVRWVMEGGVQKAGEQIQVRAQLIDPRTDGHVWANDYQRRLTAQNLFAIQGDITQKIADALEAQLTAGEQDRITGAPTENLRAYRLYVKGRSQLDTRTPEGIRRAVEYFQEALQADSAFALAWSGLADAQGLSNYASDSLGASVPPQEEAARRALELNPDLAEAHASMGGFYYQKRNAPAALRHLKRSVDLKPSYAQAQHWLGLVQLYIGRPEKGLGHVRRAVDLNPQHWAATGVLVWAYLANGQPTEALAPARRFRRMRSVWAGAVTEVPVLHHLRRYAEARKMARQGLAEADTSVAQYAFRFQLAMVEAAIGDTANARRLANRMQQSNAQSPFRGYVSAALNDMDSAFEALQKAKEHSSFYLVTLRYLYPDLLGPLRADPRYETLIRDINRSWGLNPDGSIPEDAKATTDLQSDA